MAPDYDQSKFGENTLAIHFSGGEGVRANDLGDFLRLAARISERNGAWLEVIALEPGSLRVYLKAIRNKAKSDPVGLAADGATLATAIAGALATAISISSPQPKPISKIAIKMIEEGTVSKIEIETSEGSTVVIDKAQVSKIRQRIEQPSISRAYRDAKTSRYFQSPETRTLATAASEGRLMGDAVEAQGRIYFRPAGYNYLVPVQMLSPTISLVPGRRYRIYGSLETLNGRPDLVRIIDFTEL